MRRLARASPVVVTAVLTIAQAATSGCATERLDATYRLTGMLGGETSDAASPSDARAPIGRLGVSGSRIVDAGGTPVRITGITWHGLETDTFAPAGLWVRSLPDLMAQIRALSYNSVRLTVSFRLLDADARTQGVSDQLNPGMNGLSGLETLDRVIDEAEKNRLRIILCQQGWTAGSEDALWYDATHVETDWVDRWRTLAARYRDRSTVVGFELHNAPHNDGVAVPNWGGGGSADWWAAAKRAGNAILAVAPDLLLFVDGVQDVGTDSYWWGGNLAGAEQKPIDLDVPNRVVYATHEYPKAVSNQPWFSTDPTYYEQLGPVWGAHWGYLVEKNIAPVWIAEFGTADELPWLRQLIEYATSRGVHFAYRAFNPNIDPRIGGILRDDWQTVNQDKQAVLLPALAPPIP